MVEGDLLEEETQSQKNFMEEEVAMTIHKSKKKKGKDGVRSNKTSTQEKIPSPIAQNKGGTETKMGSLINKTSCDSQEKQGKGKNSSPKWKVVNACAFTFFQGVQHWGQLFTCSIEWTYKGERGQKGPRTS